MKWKLFNPYTRGYGSRLFSDLIKSGPDKGYIKPEIIDGRREFLANKNLMQDPYMIEVRSSRAGNRNVHCCLNLHCFDYHPSQPLGTSNLARMRKGNAPLDSQRQQPMNCHHLTQTHAGPISIIPAHLHQEHSKTLHTDIRATEENDYQKFPEPVNRPIFNRERTQIWRTVGKMLAKMPAPRTTIDVSDTASTPRLR